MIYELDGEPALSCLLKDLDLPVTTALSVLQRERVAAGIERTGHGGGEVGAGEGEIEGHGRQYGGAPGR